MVTDYDAVYFVSIHARARRATTTADELFRVDYVSIHARARRATICVMAVIVIDVFQSTPARGGRREPCTG